MKVCAIDIGTVNFALRAEKITRDKIKPLHFDLVDIGEKVINREFLTSITSYLDTIDFSNYDVIFIEGQIGYMKTMGASAITNIKVQQFLESYFFIKYNELEVVIIPPNSKYPKRLKGETKHYRKTETVKIVKRILDDRGDTGSLEVMKKAGKKADDLADTIMLILAAYKKYPNLFPMELEDVNDY